MLEFVSNYWIMTKLSKINYQDFCLIHRGLGEFSRLFP